MFDLNRFHREPEEDSSEDEVVDPFMAAKRRTDLINKAKLDIRELRLKEIDGFLKK